MNSEHFEIDRATQMGLRAEVGVTAATFSSAAEFTSWVGTCPGREESAENYLSNTRREALSKM